MNRRSFFTRLAGLSFASLLARFVPTWAGTTVQRAAHQLIPEPWLPPIAPGLLVRKLVLIHPYDADELFNRQSILSLLRHTEVYDHKLPVNVFECDGTWYYMTTNVPARTKRYA